jgi:type I restriction enzyme S subunit
MVAEGYKDTEIGVIPVGWDVHTIETIKSNLNKSFTDGDWVEAIHIKNDGIRLIQTGNIGIGNFIEKNKKFISDESFEELNCYEIIEGDILICRLADPVGRCCVVPKFNTRIITSVDVAILKNNSDISDKRYLTYIFNNKDFLETADNLASGTTRRRISRKNLGKIQFPLPPLKEQEKIADILSTADAKIDAVVLQIEKAEILKKGLLQKLLSEGIGHTEFKHSELGKIPASWEVVELAKLLSFKNGVNASKEQYGKGYRFINVLDIINNLTIRHDDIIGLVDIEEKEFELYEVKYGDILFQRSSETKEEVGQSNVYLDKEQSATFGGFVIKGTAKQEYNPVFMNYLFKIPAIRKQITSKSGGSTRYNIGQNSLNQVVVQFPPLEEQKQIADILSTADEKLEVLRAKKEKYETLKKGLLQKLLSGEVRVDNFI